MAAFDKLFDTEELHYLGDRYKLGTISSSPEYILARCSTDKNLLGLINLKNGNLWTNPIGVSINDPGGNIHLSNKF